MGMPAARVGDMHMCPMVTPATPPIPHVGGPILPPGGVTVLIAAMPAARATDTVKETDVGGRVLKPLLS